MNHKVWIWGLLGIVLGAATIRAEETLRIVPVTQDEQVMVSFELADAYSDDIREAISSGLRTTFSYDLELRMEVPAWVDRTVATAVVSMSEQYDNLTRRHTLSRMVDGRVEQTLVTEDESVVRRWLTTWDRLPLCRTSTLEPSRGYYVRINARSKPHGTSLLGLTNVVTGQATFTFKP